MKIFLDANVLVSVLNKEYPVYSFSSRILSCVDYNKKIKLYTSPMCLAIAFYFAEKKSKANIAKNKIALLCKFIEIAGNSANNVLDALTNKSVHDFEDGLEYYAAKEVFCDYIITEDKEDFYFSEVEVLNCKEFFENHLSKNG